MKSTQNARWSSAIKGPTGSSSKSDHLFDRGFIGFEGTGELLISPVADLQSPQRMGVGIEQRFNVGAFAEGQRHYLEWHQEFVFLQSRSRLNVKRLSTRAGARAAPVRRP
jgi:hypothetical protein